MEEAFSLGITLLLLLGIAIATVNAWAYYRWSKLKPVLFPLSDENNQQEAGSPASDINPEQHLWLKDVPSILGRVQHVLEREKTLETQALLKALRKLETAAPELPAIAQSVITKTLKSAELHSLLVGAQGIYAYIVVIPNRHEHPHLIRRYAPFASGWGEHAEMVKASLMSSGACSALISYLFFLSPDAKEGLLLVSYSDRDISLVPSNLLQGAELKRASSRAVDAALEFRMSD